MTNNPWSTNKSKTNLNQSSSNLAGKFKEHVEHKQDHLGCL